MSKQSPLRVLDDGWGMPYRKLRRPSKDNKKDWIRIQMLVDHGYQFRGEASKDMWQDRTNISFKNPIPDTMAELEQLFISKNIVKDHKEFKKLKEKYYTDRKYNYNVLPNYRDLILQN